MSLAQHHDAITGTEKQHVANDYHRRLHRGALRMLRTLYCACWRPALAQVGRGGGGALNNTLLLLLSSLQG